jgi:hypothetical protein
MGVQVAEEEAEEGELRDRLRRAGRDDAGGAPPPPALPVLRRIPLVGVLGRRGQSLYVNPLPEAGGAGAVGGQELQQPLQIAHHDQEDRRRQPKEHGPAEDAERLLRRRQVGGRAVDGDEIVDESERPHDRQRRRHRQAEVEADARIDGGQLPDHRHQEVAAVVVADGVSRQPGVAGGEVLAAGGGVQEGEVHRLLRRRDVRDIGAEEGGEDEGEEEKHLDGEQQRPLLVEVAEDLVLPSPGQEA